MSKTISIQESGLGKTLTVDALRLPKLGGGTLDVVPADGINLVKITVKQNGTYKASDFGAYGIAEVRVACTLNGGSATSEAVTKDIAEAFTPAPSEGGVGRIFTATRIETPLSGGGACQWLRKSDVTLGTKSVNVDNTTYRAADDGYYGYSQVTVSGISITKTTDGDGNEVVEHTDGTGTETTIVPSTLALEPEPSFTGPYGDGAYISFDGMVVKAYRGDGNLWTDAKHPEGIIPFNELILPVKVADVTQQTDLVYENNDGTITAFKLFDYYVYDQHSGRGILRTDQIGTRETEYPNDEGVYFGTKTGGAFYATQFNNSCYIRHIKGDTKFRHIYKMHYGSSFVYYGNYNYTLRPGAFIGTGNPYADKSLDLPLSSVDPALNNPEEMNYVSGGQTIPVNWTRPLDNGLLETSFVVSVIDVGPLGGQGED